MHPVLEQIQKIGIVRLLLMMPKMQFLAKALCEGGLPVPR